MEILAVLFAITTLGAILGWMKSAEENKRLLDGISEIKRDCLEAQRLVIIADRSRSIASIQADLSKALLEELRSQLAISLKEQEYLKREISELSELSGRIVRLDTYRTNSKGN